MDLSLLIREANHQLRGKRSIMTLPKKNTRTLTVDAANYRWLVSVHQGVLHLTVESADGPGQTLQAFFEPHDQFKRKHDGKWSFHRQGRSITPENVARIIRHGIANGWQPSSQGKKPIHIQTWDTDKVAPTPIRTADDEVSLKDLAIDQVSELRFDVSLDSHWRKTLFAAPPLKRFPLPADYVALSDHVRKCELRFAVFNEGSTECGFVVFGIESVEFPDVVMYTTNNPAID